VKKGQHLLSSGKPVRAQDVSLLLGLGVRKVVVWRKPKVGVLATGSELTASGRRLSGKVRESHRPMFLRLCEAAGCNAVDLGIAPDEPRALDRSLRRGLALCDFVVTLGGTSAGGRDLVVGTISGMHPEVLFHGIKLDRGRVSGVASVKGKPVLMLPGPIQAAANAFFIIGYPILERLSGRSGAVGGIRCRLAKGWEARQRFADFTKVVYVRLITGDEMTAEPLSGDTESLKLLADADGFFVVPESVSRLAEGSSVMVRLIPGFSRL
jgi:molybdenum cofactor synthesis domain-containing protein